MKSILYRSICTLVAMVASHAALAAPRWQVRYFYDKYGSTLALMDLRFPSAQRGVAVGIIDASKHNAREKSGPVAVVTSDGGANWQIVPLKELPLSLYFLNENVGWMVTTKGLWRTSEAGKNWQKISSLPSGILRVHFVDENYGQAVGAKKRVMETRDGGLHWKDIPAVSDLPGDPRYSVFNWIAWATPRNALITGWNMPPRPYDQRFPEWMDPEGALRQPETPHLSYNLVTRDGGKTWKATEASLFGQVTRVRFGPQGIGLGLIEHASSFRYPSEAHKINWTDGSDEVAYRDRQFAITDIWIGEDATAYLAGVHMVGQVKNVIPGRVKIMQSRGADYKNWSEMEVDYRAVANNVVITAAGDQNIWLATDHGMILKLVR